MMMMTTSASTASAAASAVAPRASAVRRRRHHPWVQTRKTKSCVGRAVLGQLQLRDGHTNVVGVGGIGGKLAGRRNHRRRDGSCGPRRVVIAPDEGAVTAPDEGAGGRGGADSQDDDACVAERVTNDPGLNAALLTNDACGLSISRKFNTKEWNLYQSPTRYFTQLTTVQGSVVAKRVALPVVAIAAWSVCVALASERVPELRDLAAASPYLQILGGAVSLLLVFRTNAAFSRFCMASDSFGDVLSATRNLSRKMAVWCPVEQRSANARLVAAIPWAIKHRGQGIEGSAVADAQLAKVLDAEQMAALDTRVNVPSQLLTEMTRSLDRFNDSKVELIYQLLMDNDLTTLHKEVARTDRLVSTPTPVSYTRHISRSIMLWLLALPVVATDAFRFELLPGRVGTAHHVILQSKHQLMTPSTVHVTNLKLGSGNHIARHSARVVAAAGYRRHRHAAGAAVHGE
jgi:predicted membrane chloride channel (bestrophin family)